jgi:hypothetical protein
MYKGQYNGQTKSIKRTLKELMITKSLGDEDKIVRYRRLRLVL